MMLGQAKLLCLAATESATATTELKTGAVRSVRARGWMGSRITVAKLLSRMQWKEVGTRSLKHAELLLGGEVTTTCYLGSL